jgi:hypothetical protein
MFLSIICAIVLTVCIWLMADYYRGGGRNIKDMQVPAIISLGLAIFLLSREPVTLALVLLVNGGYDYFIRGKRIKR